MAPRSQINPGPAATPGSNDHRVGAPNHHQTTGSGETPMVDAQSPIPSFTDALLAVA